MFSKKLADCSNVEVNEVMQLLDGLMSSDSGRVRLREAGEGYDPNVQPIEVSRFTYLPIQSFHRPFIFYGAISVAAQMGGVCLRRMGFQLCQGRHLNYWYYEGKPFIAPACTKDTNYPVVLSHGVGVGAFTYMYFISKIMAKYRGNKSIFLPECPYVSMKLAADHVPSAEEHAVSIKESLEKHGYSKAIFCGHSYGTFMGTFAVRFYPDIVERLVLIDPVCFLLHQPQGVINFIKGQKPTSALQSMMKYLAKTELGILHTLQRHVWWYNNSLWANLIPPNSSVVLSAHDDITPSHLVRDYLEKENELLSVDKKESRGNLRQKVNIVWFKNLGHAGFQMNGKAIEKILSSCFP